jgi:putative membrane protein
MSIIAADKGMKIFMTKPDPRVFFAAERTLLAWLRTSVTILGLGFVIARFGIFLRFVSLKTPASTSPDNFKLSAIIGISLVVAGSLLSLVATLQHKRYISTLPQSDLPPSYSGAFAVWFGVFLSLIGLILALYLVISQV